MEEIIRLRVSLLLVFKTIALLSFSPSLLSLALLHCLVNPGLACEVAVSLIYEQYLRTKFLSAEVDLVEGKGQTNTTTHRMAWPRGKK